MTVEQACGGVPVELLAELEVHRGERIALVGGGGKTGLASRLVAEARAQGWTSLFTTTTKVLAPCAEDAAPFVTGEGRPDPVALRRHLLERGHLFLARRWLEEWEETPAGRLQKVGGFAPAEVDRLAAALAPDLLIVEADGSRHRPFKAPAPYEPQVPSTTTLLLVLAGLTVLGSPLDGGRVHRPERVAALAGAPSDAPVNGALVAAVLLHPQGGLKGRPAGARAAAVLTQAAAARRAAGRELSRRLLQVGGFERVLLADLDDPAGCPEPWRRSEDGSLAVGPPGLAQVHIVVLAAGASRRMGCDKLLLPLHGRPLLAHAVDAALGAPAAAVWVVVGAGAAALRHALGTRPLRFVANRRWREGQAASIRAAVAALPPSAGAVLFLAGDMPFVPAAHLERLVERWRAGHIVVWSKVDDARRIPAIFGREAFPALLGLTGDVGGRALAGRFAEESVPAAADDLLDIDTPEAYEQARCRPGER